MPSNGLEVQSMLDMSVVQNFKTAVGKRQPHATQTCVGEPIPCRIRRPMGKHIATFTDGVCGRLKNGLERASTTG